MKISGSTHLNLTKKEELTTRAISSFGAGSRGRTDTVLLPSDFESDASANSTIPANGSHLYATLYIIAYRNQKINIFGKFFLSAKYFVFSLAFYLNI